MSSHVAADALRAELPRSSLIDRATALRVLRFD